MNAELPFRVSDADLDAAIESVEIVQFASASGRVLRWAVLNMRNGFPVVGRPSCSADPRFDNPEQGGQRATENSRAELRTMMNYELASKHLAARKPEDA